MMDFVKKLFGQGNEVEVKRLQKIADQVLAREDEYKSLSDTELKAKTEEFRARYQGGGVAGAAAAASLANLRSSDRMFNTLTPLETLSSTFFRNTPSAS